MLYAAASSQRSRKRQHYNWMKYSQSVHRVSLEGFFADCIFFNGWAYHWMRMWQHDSSPDVDLRPFDRITNT